MKKMCVILWKKVVISSIIADFYSELYQGDDREIEKQKQRAKDIGNMKNEDLQILNG